MFYMAADTYIMRTRITDADVAVTSSRVNVPHTYTHTRTHTHARTQTCTHTHPFVPPREMDKYGQNFEWDACYPLFLADDGEKRNKRIDRRGYVHGGGGRY